MMMTRSKRIEPVVRIAENREREAARRVGDSQRNLEAQRARLLELQAYRDDYAKRFAATGSGGLGAAMLHDYRAFLGKLNQAIEHQKRLIQAGERAYEDSRRQWLDSRGRMKALDTVAERYRRDEYRQQERREQNELDERAQRVGPRSTEH